jgi:hypothetical protein
MLWLMRSLFIILSWIFSASVTAGFYKWVDEDGAVHYSDRPVPHAQQVRISTGGSKKAVPATAADAAEEESEGSLSGEIAGYRQFDIVVPAENESIRNNDGRVNIGLLLEPGLQEGHKIALKMDGNLLDGRFETTQLALQKLARGSHRLQAVIFDAEGQLLTQSRAVNFHLRREPNRPPPAAIPEEGATD